MLWLLEPDVFGIGPHPLTRAVADAGQRSLPWTDDLWGAAELPTLEGPVLFHGSLGNAARIAALGRWRPGAFCDTAQFCCSRWYPAAAPWLVQRDVIFTTVAALSSDPTTIAGALADPAGEVFIRPDSPLKPFAGRVARLDGFTPAALDHGFYYDDLELPVVVSRKQSLGSEWRFVVCDRAVITGSSYAPADRSASAAPVDPAARAVAEAIAAELESPESVYVLDLVATDAGLRLLELNPFSGADLYACDSRVIVDAIGRLVETQ
jgi:hypothetical protein